MQGNDSSVKGSAPTPIPTKYRLACDSCQQSKIRCDQERPKCRRCAKKGIECVYSPARRAGRPRTRNKSKSSSGIEHNTSTNLIGFSRPTAEYGISTSTSDWIPPFAPLSMPPACEHYSRSSSSSNTSTVASLTQSTQIPNQDDLELCVYQQSVGDFMQGLLDITSSQCGTPKQTMSPEFYIAPELLNMDFGGEPWEQQHQQQQENEHHESTSTTMSIDEGLPYFGLLTPEDHQPLHHLDQHQEDRQIPHTTADHIESCNYTITTQQQVQPQVSQSLDHGLPSTISCNCVSILLDHMSTPFQGPSLSSFSSVSDALHTSRILITYCYTTIECPNACATHPSAVLVICEAIARALNSLRLGGSSLWLPTLAPNQCQENDTSSRSSSSPSSSLSSTSGGNSNHIMLSPSGLDEEHETLRCGTLPIRGADRRAVVRVLLVKRLLEVQGVLERLRDRLRTGLLVSRDTQMMQKPLLLLCADVVGQFTKKVAQRVETVKLQI
jgi:hypothetical protein